MQNVDTLISARWIVPVVPEHALLENHTLVVAEGRIVDILPTPEAHSRYRAESHHVLDQHVVIPGLVNAHTHAAMNLMRGLADDRPLMEWLNEHIWPVEGQFVSEAFVRDGTELAVAEMLRSGTTCFNDMYFFPEITARVATRAGIRASIGLLMIDFPSAWGSGPEEYLRKSAEIFQTWHNQPLVSMTLAPHAPYTVSDEPLRRLKTLADQLELPVHMHVHETAHEVQEAERQQGRRPLARLQQLGLLDPSLVAVHMTQLTDEEIATLARQGVNVVHCPESNLKLASGFCPLVRLLEAGVNVALGTDGVASNNDLDMLGEARTAALLAKGVSGNAAAVPAFQALQMATLNGARALGLDDQIGSLEVGKVADITAVDLSALETQPIYDPISHLVYATDRERISDVWVAGRHLLRQRRLTTLDEKKLLAKAQDWQARISEVEA